MADELIFVVGYGAEAVRSYFGDEYGGVPVSFAVQEEQLGTADAVAAAKELLEGRFAVLNGDALYDAESSAASTTPRRRSPPTALTTRLATASCQRGRHHRRHRRETGRPANGPGERRRVRLPGRGTGLAGRAPQRPRGARNHGCPSRSHRGVDSHRRCGRPLVGRGPALGATRGQRVETRQLDRRLDGDVRGDADLRGEVVVEAGAVIEPGVVIEWPALVRSGAHVGPNAYIRGATLLGEVTHVGHGVELENTVLMADSNVPHVSYVGDSVIGRDVNFGAGTQVANLRHDGDPVRMTVKGDRVSTGRRKFGVVAGDGAKTAINTSLTPALSSHRARRRHPANPSLGTDSEDLAASICVR